MNIIQQILSLSTDFFNTNMESLVTGQASLTDVTLGCTRGCAEPGAGGGGGNVRTGR